MQVNILAIGAHHDDVEFLCAGTLLKYRSQGHNIFIALTTSGNQGSSKPLLPPEGGSFTERMSFGLKSFAHPRW
jgi:LmbE family N-acetylglucosaminyl deacetylase